MKAKKLVKTIIFVCIFAFFAVMPIAVLAVIYNSRQSENNFSPAQTDIQIDENGNKGDELLNNYTFEFSNDIYTIDKPVAVYDQRNSDSDYLRVRFVPMWFDENENICSIDGVTDFCTTKLDSSSNTLIFCDADNKTLLTLRLDSKWSESWKYNSADCCFYYSGLINPGQTTPLLLSGVEISKNVYNNSQGYKLRIDVLADAIQQYGDSVKERSWSAAP